MLGPLRRACSKAIAIGLVVLGAGCEKRSSANAEPDPIGDPARPAQPAEWWVSPEDCRRSLELDPPRRTPGRARIGTWNVRWFPDGKPGGERRSAGTDVAWLACGIARLGVDLLAVQEFKLHERGVRATDELVRALDRWTQGRWKLETEVCGRADDGHVGLLWDTTRVDGRALGEASEPLGGKPCDLDWRPALSGYFRFAGGFDVHVAALHLVAGAGRSRVDAREVVYSRLATLRRSLVDKNGDSDVILLGDLNTSGCNECEPPRSSLWEADRLREILGRSESKLSVVASSLPCSEYHDNAAFLLDHFVVDREMRELAKEARAVIGGYCIESKCDEEYEPDEREYYDEISDHCPLVLELADRDLD